MDDQDISAFNSGGTEAIFSNLAPGQLIQDKIARVLYDCTDEHNKAFNKAMMEKSLYDAGAFWVSEISPKKITVTVNRTAIGGDATPEDNLVEYLTERNMDEEDVGEHIAVARPIIQAAIAGREAEHQTGVFTPLEIKVHNYRNYRDETFSFEDIRFCTINGRNGVGKSSLFMDALLDALYEEPREGDLTGWICNAADARSGSIELTFRLGDRRYRITRTRTKSGKATLNLSEYADGEWVNRSAEKIKDTQALIEQTIGMDSLTLKACGLIMQDQYGLFLQADKEARVRILGNILGLGIYDTMYQMAATAATDANRQMREYHSTAANLMAGLPDKEALTSQRADLARQAEQAKANLAAKTTERDALKLREQTAADAAARAQKAAERLDALAQKKKRLEELQGVHTARIETSNNILAREAEIAAGVQHHPALLEQEKGLLAEEATAQAKAGEVDRLLAEVSTAEGAHKDLMAALCAAQEAFVRAQAERDITQGYEADAARYAAAVAEKAALDIKKQQFTDAQARLNEIRAAAERAHLERLRPLDLKAQEKRRLDENAALLDTVGCPAEYADACRFLSAAVAARDALPTLADEIEALTRQDEEAAEQERVAVREAEDALVAVGFDAARNMTVLCTIENTKAAAERYARLPELERALQQAKDSLSEAELRLHAAGSQLDTMRGRLEAARQEVAKYDTQALARIQAAIRDARAWLDMDKELPAARQAKEQSAALLAQIAADLSEVEQERQEQQAEYERNFNSEDFEAIRIPLATAEQAVSDYTSTLRNLDQRLGSIDAALVSLGETMNRVAGIQKQASEAAQQATIYENLKAAFSQDGIPHNIIRTIIPVLESTATNILGQMSGGRMSVEFVTEKALKSNSKKEVTTLDIIINDTNTGPLPYMSRSGGERVKAALSVILALSEIKSSEAGVQLGFLFIDEPPFLDADGVQAYCDALETIQTRYSDLKIMAITHDPAMKSRFPQSVDVEKTPDGSKVVYS